MRNSLFILVYFAGQSEGSVVELSRSSGLVVPVSMDTGATVPWIALDLSKRDNWIYAQELCPFTLQCSGIDNGVIGNGFELTNFKWEERQIRPSRHHSYVDVIGLVGASPQSDLARTRQLRFSQEKSKLAFRLVHAGELHGIGFESHADQWKMAQVWVDFLMGGSKGSESVGPFTARLDLSSPDIVLPSGYRQIIHKKVGKSNFEIVVDRLYLACSLKKSGLELASTSRSVVVPITLDKSDSVPARSFGKLCATNILLRPVEYVILGSSVLTNHDVVLSHSPDGNNLIVFQDRQEMGPIFSWAFEDGKCWKLTREDSTDASLSWMWQRSYDSDRTKCLTILKITESEMEAVVPIRVYQEDGGTAVTSLGEYVPPIDTLWLGKPQISVDREGTIVVRELWNPVYHKAAMTISESDDMYQLVRLEFTQMHVRRVITTLEPGVRIVASPVQGPWRVDEVRIREDVSESGHLKLWTDQMFANHWRDLGEIRDIFFGEPRLTEGPDGSLTLEAVANGEFEYVSRLTRESFEMERPIRRYEVSILNDQVLFNQIFGSPKREIEFEMVWPPRLKKRSDGGLELVLIPTRWSARIEGEWPQIELSGRPQLMMGNGQVIIVADSHASRPFRGQVVPGRSDVRIIFYPIG